MMGFPFSIKNNTRTDLELKANGKSVCALKPGQTFEPCITHTLSRSIMLTVIRNTDGSEAKRRVFSGLTNEENYNNRVKSVTDYNLLDCSSFLLVRKSLNVEYIFGILVGFRIL